jgi:sterol desaturase/sphingolipid hydroxylase (fatty acid hydroxylase superfamily)
LTNHSLWFYWLLFFGAILTRYFLIVGGAYFLFYSVLKIHLTNRSFRLKPPQGSSLQKDIELSVLSGAVFALSAALITKYGLEATLIYTDLHKYGLWYLGISFVAVLILQDTYFYFIHRMLHHPRIFKWMHHGHHLSGDPTPWTSFTFDLPEAILQVLFFVGVIFTIPLHLITLIVVLMTMTVWAVFTHLGFEVLPLSSTPHWLERWFIGSMHHSIHHRKYKVNYGLYFTFWDKLLGTEEPNYETKSHVGSHIT